MFHGTGAAHAARSFHDATSSPYTRSEAFTDPRRKQTIISLLDVPSELSNQASSDNDANLPSNFEDDRDVPTVDEKLQVAGSELFNKFERRMDNLDKELRNFANTACQLGSSVGILSSAFRLWECLTKLLFLFREITATLFPQKISPIHDDGLDPESFPGQFASFAEDVMTLLNCLNEFPEFTDEGVNTSMHAFEVDLKYWALCLQEYKGNMSAWACIGQSSQLVSGQFWYPAVQRYIHDLTSEIGEHINNITINLSMFIEIGVPTIRFAQQHAAANLLNLSTVATFFSAVTAMTLQFSYQLTDGVLENIAAAVNRLLGLTWKQAMYRSVVLQDIGYLVFLVMPVACFSAGLMLFTYATDQDEEEKAAKISDITHKKHLAMGATSKANKARLRNIQSALSRSHKTTIEDVSDSEEESDSSCSDSEDDIGFSVEEGENVNDEAALLTFSEILFRAQDTAVKGERQRSKDTRRPKHYSGNSTRTLRHHALERKRIAETNQAFISSWIKKKPEVVGVQVKDIVTESPFDHEPDPVQEEEEESSESESDSFMGKNPSQLSPVEILSSKKDEQIQKMLEDIRNGQPPCDDSPETFTDSVLNAMDYKDFPALRRARAKIAVSSKDKKLDVVFRSHITAMLGALNLYLDPELSYGWREASLVASKSLGQGINHARNIRTWIHQFLCNEKLPLH
ncbi:uncharacterized protein F5891DRAFT_1194680 [Suillus fuscotomentosus]|uniref:Uncharacterized protein n=1 Tax=Suillus fuscotomentosus TaxID=1912939 RepID=A0AAD4HFW5_9AGAM|nr:uncharacterized protein F5891DRAFT_1194680 [Suillus fuscotomentosus]KAG1895017.1 hypothetical protein F5891DRAFT_1194680 [Suillus fuscotomentosus]